MRDDSIVLCACGCGQSRPARGKNGDRHYYIKGHWRRCSAEERFWSKVDRNGPVPAHRPELGPCYLWTGMLDRNGYGLFHDNAVRHLVAAHRYGYVLQNGPIDRDEMALHRCDVGRCVRGEHLFKGDHAANMADMASKGRSTRGERHHRAKLTDALVMDLRRRYAAGGVSQKELAAAADVSPATMSELLSGKHWTHLHVGPACSTG